MPVQCMSCMDAGFITYDGVARKCPAGCDSSDRWEKGGGAAKSSRSTVDSRQLPPGGEVLVREAQREAAGLPVGLLGSDSLVRATIEAEPLVHDLVRALARIAVAEQPAAAQADTLELLKRLPPWALPDDVVELLDKGGDDADDLAVPARSAAAPLTAPDGA